MTSGNERFRVWVRCLSCGAEVFSETGESQAFEFCRQDTLEAVVVGGAGQVVAVQYGDPPMEVAV